MTEARLKEIKEELSVMEIGPFKNALVKEILAEIDRLRSEIDGSGHTHECCSDVWLEREELREKIDTALEVLSSPLSQSQECGDL